MKVRALVSFVSRPHGLMEEGQEFDLPDGVDWLKAGLVEPVEEQPAAKPRAKRAAIGRKPKSDDA